MAEIQQVLLPDELNEDLVSLLYRLPDSVMATAAKLLPGGFKDGAVARQRINAMIRSSGRLEPWLVSLLRDLCPAIIAVRVLSREALEELYEPFVTLAGRKEVLLALLLDPREEVHKLGAQKLAQPVAPEQDREAAIQALCKFVDEHLLIAAKMTVSQTQGIERADHDAAREVKRLRDKNEELFKGLKDSVGLIEYFKRALQEQSQKQQTRLERVTREAGQEKQRLAKERDAARVSLNRLAKEKDALAARLTDMTAAYEASIAHEAEQRTSLLVRKWLALPLEAEQHLQEINVTAGNLLGRVEQALQAQARQDRLTAERLAIERKLRELEEGRTRLLRAAQQALSPVPAVKEVLAEVEEQIRREENRLTPTKNIDPLTEKLLLGINQAPGWREAQSYSNLVEELADLGLVPKGDRRRLYGALQHKFSLLQERLGFDEEPEAPDNGWSLRNMIYRNRPSVLLLDGHNLLFGLEDLFRPYYGAEDRPTRKARERLVQLMERLVAVRANVHVRIVFDAPTHRTLKLTSNITVEYSGGGHEEHRADRRIGKALDARCPEELAQRWFVVSDDRAVRWDATRSGALYVPSDLFAVLLADFGCLSEEPSAVNVAA